MGALSTGLVIGTPAAARLKVVGVLLFANLSACLFVAPKMRSLARQLREHRLGFKGERVIGEELNQLLADGFEVYHDLPFERYNIDHLIVGACGVFAVETKTRSKRAEAKWEKKAKVTFDGERITFGEFVETDAVKQARLNAKDLARWLSKATGDAVSVDSIITSPGWFVPDALPIDGLAMWNSSRIRSFLLAKPRTVLSAAQIKRICHQLDQRCAWVDANPTG